MKHFEKIIGYSSIKKELMQIADTLQNSEAYLKLGVTAPKGLLLYGEPGVGKTLMANSLLKPQAEKYLFAERISQMVTLLTILRKLLIKQLKMHRRLFFLMIWINLQMVMNTIGMQKNM